jgi:tRNA (cytosine40_48-C5)-methyltransferase
LKTLIFPSSLESDILAKSYGYDEWLVERFLQYIPNVKCLLEAMNRHPQQYIRTNTLKIDSKDLVRKLVSKGFELEDTILHDVFAIKKNTSLLPIGATTEYLLGYYYIQDLSSCIAVEELEIGENQTVLDMASAPGGKTSFIAQKMNNTGLIIALEPNLMRIRSISFNLARCGVMNTCIYKMSGQQAIKLNLKFDRVLLDAPCTCEGIIGKDSARKTNHKPEDIEFCAMGQTSLIESAVKLVKPGGLLIYSTCSFAPEENENIINSLLGKFDIEIEPIQHGSEGLTSFGSFRFHHDLKKTKRFYPHIHNTLGFYIAKLRVNN